MPYSAQWRKHAVQPVLAALFPMMMCSAAAAQSPPGGSPLLAQFRSGDTETRGYGDGAAGTPWQRQPYPSGRGGGFGYGSRSGPAPWSLGFRRVPGPLGPVAPAPPPVAPGFSPPPHTPPPPPPRR